jgi:hypothetical protein
MNYKRFCKDLFLLWASLSFVEAAFAEFPAAPEVVHFPKSIPPIVDADPSDRHPASIHMPAKYDAIRKGDRITYTPVQFEEMKLTVGKNMETGHSEEMKIRRGSKSADQWLSMSSGMNWQPSDGSMLNDNGKWPQGAFTLEYTITFFETDIPAQHMWSPQSGKNYKVLWTRTYRMPIK